MSQDSQTLHLQFATDAPQRLFERWLVAYTGGDTEAQQRWGRMLGLQGDELAADEWFNVESQVDGVCFVVSYDTRTSGGPPLRLLQRLYERRLLGGVVLSTFHDQVGESSALMFDDGHQVSPDHLKARRPELAPVIDALDELMDEDEDGEPVLAPDSPRPIAALIEARERSRRDAEEAVEAMRDLFKAARESGTHPLELLQAASLMQRLLRMAAWVLGSLVVGGLLLAYTPLRWWALPLLLWLLVSYRYMNRAMGEQRWATENWSFHLSVWLTGAVLIGGFFVIQSPALQWVYAIASATLAGLMLWSLGESLFGERDAEELAEAIGGEGADGEDAPPARWMEVLGTVVLSLPSFVTAVAGVIWSLALPVVQGLFGQG